MYRKHEKKEILAVSRCVMPGGVNSPVRAFGAVSIDPVIVDHAEGAYITDVDGKQYIDYVCSYGPLIFGHAPQFIVEQVQHAAARGTTYGFTTPQEVELAELITQAYPACEMVRMVNSGTEATMSAIRVARAYTGRQKILKFEGCYHGHCDSLLVKSGSGLITHGVPTSPGLVPALVDQTLVCPYNDETVLSAMIAENREEIACVIIEPVAGNMGVVAPKAGYLQAVRDLCSKNGILLIFDEVITGFRLGYHSAAGAFGVTPDMVCFGKIIGGGLPVGAYGGRRDIMQMVSPVGPVYQAGTLSGNPLAMQAGIAALKRLRDNPEIYDTLEESAAYLNTEITRLAKEYEIPAVTSQYKSMFCLFFSEQPVTCYADVMHCDTERYRQFFEAMAEAGVLLAPSQYEAWFLSTAHTQTILEQTVAAVERVFGILRERSDK